MPSRQVFLSVFPRDMIAPGGSLCSQTIREAKETRIKTFQSGLFRPAILHPPPPPHSLSLLRLAFTSLVQRNWKNTEETELETPRRPGKMAHRKLGLAPSNFTYQKCLDRKRIEGGNGANHPNTNSSPQRTPLSTGMQST